MDITNVAEGTIGKVLGLIIVLAVLGGTIGLVFTNLSTVIDAFNATTPTGDPVADAIIPVLGILVAVGVVLGLVALVLRAAKE